MSLAGRIYAPHFETAILHIQTTNNCTKSNWTLLIVPNSIHTEPRLRNIQSRNPAQKLLMPSIYLNPALLIVRERQPPVTPRERADCIRMATARRRRV